MRQFNTIAMTCLNASFFFFSRICPDEEEDQIFGALDKHRQGGLGKNTSTILVKITPFGIMGELLWAHLKPFSTIVCSVMLWVSQYCREAPNPRKTSRLIAVVFPVGAVMRLPRDLFRPLAQKCVADSWGFYISCRFCPETIRNIWATE